MSNLEMIGVNGRYPPDGPAFVPGNIETTITKMGDYVEIRLEDESQPAFWIHLRIRVKSAVEELLKAKSSAN